MLLAALASAALSGPAIATPPAETLASRSARSLPLLVAYDRRTADAIEAKSLPALRSLFHELGADSADADARQSARGVITSCDLTVSSLLVIVGFAIDKLDGEGRYETWMLDESLSLIETAGETMRDCARDAGLPLTTPRLTAQLVKAL